MDKTLSYERVMVITALEDMDVTGMIWDEGTTWDEVAVKILTALGLPEWEDDVVEGWEGNICDPIPENPLPSRYSRDA